jgi:hypothetical protein
MVGVGSPSLTAHEEYEGSSIFERNFLSASEDRLKASNCIWISWLHVCSISWEYRLMKEIFALPISRRQLHCMSSGTLPKTLAIALNVSFGIDIASLMNS